MKTTNTRELVELSLYSALIVIAVQFLRIPLGGQFVHLGNALVVVGVLIYGSKRGALVASIGLGIFDVLNGYATEVWITILESLIVCLVLHFVYERGLKAKDRPANIISVGILAAVTKIILNFVKYTIRNSLISAMPISAAMLTALGEIGGTFGTALVTIVAVPLLYPVLKRISNR